MLRSEVYGQRHKRTCREHVREEREGEEDEGQDEVAEASDGYGSVAPNWKGQRCQRSVELMPVAATERTCINENEDHRKYDHGSFPTPHYR